MKTKVYLSETQYTYPIMAPPPPNLTVYNLKTLLKEHNSISLFSLGLKAETNMDSLKLFVQLFHIEFERQSSEIQQICSRTDSGTFVSVFL